MDWRPSSRSRSRSTFNRNRNPYEHASEIHSQAMLASGRDMPLQEQLLAYTQSTSHDDQWPLSHYLSGDSQVNPNGALSSAPERRQLDQQEDLVGISSFTSQFSPQHQGHRQPMGMSKSAFEYDQAIRTAAAYDTFASSVPSNQPLHLSGELLPSSVTSQSGPSATLALSPKNFPKLPGISGPGLYDETRENFHPQYGFLPRRVRKTSFDHTVAQGSSAESGSGLLPPPRAGKVSQRHIGCISYAYSLSSRQVRKRSADVSPFMAPQNKLEPVSASVDLPLPTSASVNVPPGSFPNTAFTFSVPGSYEAFFDINAASGNTPNPPSTSGGSSELDPASADMGPAYLQALQNMFDQGVLDEATRAILGPNFGSESTDPTTGMAALQAGLIQPENAFDFQQLMQQYLHTNATANPFTHINPAHVLGASSNSTLHPLATSGTLSNFSSPTGMSPSIHAPQMLQNPGPTKPLPKVVGGKTVSLSQKPHPVRSNSSPNLVALKLSAMAQEMKGGDNSKVAHGGGDKGSNHRQGHKSGPSTPSSEDTGGTVMSTSETPTHCSNCQTTKTPLWRRDPEGQPLCNVSQVLSICSLLIGCAYRFDVHPCRRVVCST